MKRLVYRPEITAYVRLTDTNEVIDISDDITNATITRRLNALSTAQLTLQNRSGRYTYLMKPMDVIVIWMTRVNRQLVFSGYLDDAPLYQRQPGSVQINASCTLKLLQNTYFDPSLPFMTTFFNSIGGQKFTYDPFSGQITSPGGTFGDFDINNGWATVLRAMLVAPQLGGWDPKHVHITGLPTNFLTQFAVSLQEAEIETQQQWNQLVTTLQSTMNGGSDAGLVPGSSLGDSASQFATALKQSNKTATTQLSANQIANAGVIWQTAQDFQVPDLVTLGLIADSFAEANLETPNPTNTTANPGAIGLFQLTQDGGYYGASGWLAKAVQKYNKTYSGVPICSNTDPIATNAQYNTAAFLMANLGTNYTTLNDPSAGTNPADVQLPDGSGSVPAVAICQSDHPYYQIVCYWENPGVSGAEQDIRTANGLWQNLIGAYQILSNMAAGSLGVQAEIPGQPVVRQSQVASGSLTGLVSPVASNAVPGGIGMGKAFTQSVDYLALSSGRVVQVGTTSAGTTAGRASLVSWANWGAANSNLFTYDQARPIPLSIAAGDPQNIQIVTDCSGFIILISKWAGVTDPSGNNFNGAGSSDSIAAYCTQITSAQVAAGDLIVYGPLGATHHVVVVTGVLGGGDFSVVSDGVQGDPHATTHSAEAAYQSAAGYPGVTFVSWLPSSTQTSTPAAATIVYIQLDNTISVSGRSYSYVYYNGTTPTVTQGANVTVGDTVAAPGGAVLGFADSIPGGGYQPSGTTSYNGKDPTPAGNDFWTLVQAINGVGTAASKVSIGAATIASTGGIAGAATSTTAALQALAGGTNALGQYTETGTTTDSILAMALTGEKALSNCVNLFDWFQTMTTAGGRVFTSLPNGDFYAFFPDYFGWFGARTAYYTISDLELVDLTIQLSDADLSTHVFSIGTMISLSDSVTENDQLFPQVASVSDVAFNTFINPKVNGKREPFDPLAFLDRYGARPYVYDVPEIRHPMLLWMAAWMMFAQLWAGQASANATVTFIPELFPGGLVSIAGEFQMFIQEVTHTMDRLSGYSTSVTLQAPARPRSDNQTFGSLMLPNELHSSTSAQQEIEEALNNPMGSVAVQRRTKKVS